MSCQVLCEFRAFLGIMFFLTLYACLLRKRRGYWTWAFGPIEMPGSFAGSSTGICAGICKQKWNKGKQSCLFSMDHVFFDRSQKHGGRMRPRRPQTRKLGSRRRASYHAATSHVSVFYEFKRRNMWDRSLALQTDLIWLVCWPAISKDSDENARAPHISCFGVPVGFCEPDRSKTG